MMGAIILLTVLIIVGIYCFRCRLLWLFVQYRYQQFYTLLKPELTQLPEQAIIYSQDSDLRYGCLLQKYTRKTIYWHTQKTYFFWQRLLLRLCHIQPVKQYRDDQYPGIVLTHDQALITNKYASIFLCHLCNLQHLRQSNSRLSQQWLQLSLRPFDEKHDLTRALEILDVTAWDSYAAKLPSLSDMWLHQAKRGKNRLSIADSTGVELSHHRLLTAVITLKNKLKPKLQGQQNIGVCLPPSVAATSSMLSLLALGKTLVNLNYTASLESLDSAMVEAAVTTIITSRRFVDTLKKKGFEVSQAFANTTVIYLEDIKQTMHQLDLLKTLLLVKLLPYCLLKRDLLTPRHANDVAAILFSSGSEGKPKGVMLTEKNMVINIKQAASAMHAVDSDVFLGILPIFHAFGLTVASLLPMTEGLPVVCHPDPRDATVIGALAEKYQATILCATSTFFRLYSKSRGLKSERFRSLRYVIAGAEKLQSEVREAFLAKFDKIIYEGYGTTELSPVASVNRLESQRQSIPHKIGTIGFALAGCAMRIVDPDTLQELPTGQAGLLVVGGGHIMQGYLNNPDKTAEVIFERDGIRFYQTGDKAKIDADGFVTILDRYSRFAKLGGEMVSLSAIEQLIKPMTTQDSEILATAIPDAKKGEVVCLLVAGMMDVKTLQMTVTQSDMLNLMKPQWYLPVEQIPKLGTGKTDFAAAKKIALESLSH